MKKFLLSLTGIIVVTVAALAYYFLSSPSPGDLSVNFSRSDLYDGIYEVGSVTNYVKNFDEPFDAWGKIYGGKDYQALVAKVEASGEPRTTVSEIWYPAASTEGYKQATYGDFFDGNTMLAERLIGFYAMKMTDEQIRKATAGVENLPRKSFIGAPAVEEKFPLVIFVHGLGNKRTDWADSAELLASRGYVVVAMTMTSDGNLPPIFNDPNSRYARATGATGVEAAYEIMKADISVSNGLKIFPHIFGYLYGATENTNPPSFMSGNFPDMSKTIPGGADKTTGMMAALFQQRLTDIRSIIAEMKILNSDRASCEAHFAEQGLKEKACGLLESRINLDRIGVSGHSLGSMSTQIALRQIPEVTAGLGMSNGAPKTWEPQYHGLAPEGTRENIDKPMFFLHGSEDHFIYFLFQMVLGKWYENAGGDRSELFPLADERKPRTPENTQPVNYAAYNRALGPKISAAILGADHGSIRNETLLAHLRKGGADVIRVARHLPDNQGLLGAFPGRKFNVLEDVTGGDGESFIMSSFIADYYINAWFDWTLKDDSSGLDRVQKTPFSQFVKVKSKKL